MEKLRQRLSLVPDLSVNLSLETFSQGQEGGESEEDADFFWDLPISDSKMCTQGPRPKIT